MIGVFIGVLVGALLYETVSARIQARMKQAAESQALDDYPPPIIRRGGIVRELRPHPCDLTKLSRKEPTKWKH